jgi:uncharacterized damage-inducible protein DinB
VTASPLQPLYEGWAKHNGLIVAAIEPLTPDQLALRPAPGMWAVWQLAAHMAGARAYWIHDRLGEGDPALRDRFRVTHSNVPDLPIEDAGWEDDEDHPRTANELADALRATRAMVDECLGRWSPEDLATELVRPGSSRVLTRAWVIWHLMEHDVHHGGEISVILGSHGVPALDL